MREKREVSIPGVTHRSTAYHSLICPARRRRWRPRPPPTGYYFACPFVLSASERSKPVPRRGIVEGIANTTEYPGVRSQGDASVRASALCSAVPPFLRVIVCRSVFVPFLRVPSSDRNTHNLLRRHRSWLFSTENWNCLAAFRCGCVIRVVEDRVAVKQSKFG